jgi:Fe2+ transport system protein FeoA
MEMGILEGDFVQVLFKAPLGDPIAINVKGYTLSLRKDEAALVEVDEDI